MTTEAIGLFVPCYIDQLYPDVARATLELLEGYGCRVDFPEAQTCCGQPMANSGCTEEARPLAERFLDTFRDYKYVVCPSGSCTAMVRLHYDEYLRDRPGFEELKAKTFELCEFLCDVLHADPPAVRFPHRVALHQSCHGLRELRLGGSSEVVAGEQPPTDKVRRLLEPIDGLEIATLRRSDECCGFGGAFSVSEEAVSCMMGIDRLEDHQQAGAEVVTAADMSCLMHLSGLARRRSSPLRFMHVAQILAGRPKPA